MCWASLSLLLAAACTPLPPAAPPPPATPLPSLAPPATTPPTTTAAAPAAPRFTLERLREASGLRVFPIAQGLLVVEISDSAKKAPLSFLLIANGTRSPLPELDEALAPVAAMDLVSDDVAVRPGGRQERRL